MAFALGEPDQATAAAEAAYDFDSGWLMSSLLANADESPHRFGSTFRVAEVLRLDGLAH